MEKDADIGFILIDTVIGPYSPKSDIQGWIKELRQMADRPEVREAITQAESWLKE